MTGQKMSQAAIAAVSILAAMMPRAREMGVDGCERKALERNEAGDRRGYRLWVAAAQLVAWEAEP